jgi:hypothetical protein
VETHPAPSLKPPPASITLPKREEILMFLTLLKRAVKAALHDAVEE